MSDVMFLVAAILKKHIKEIVGETSALNFNDQGEEVRKLLDQAVRLSISQLHYQADRIINNRAFLVAMK